MMTRQEIIDALYEVRYLNDVKLDIHVKAIDEAIYYIGIIDELKHERDAALDTAYAALKMRNEKI